MASPDQVLSSMGLWFRNLSTGGKISLLIVIAGAILGGVLVKGHYDEVGYQFLYTGLSSADVNVISEKLGGMKIPYKMRGDAIMVPGDKVLELRNTLALEGIPRGGGVGFEIFDKTNFGATEFQQKLNYARALQGELARTISHIDGVLGASVHLVIPDQALFKDEQKSTSASITLNLAKGRKLSNGQIQAIAHLVSSSVEGLTTANITIVDNNGDLLFRREGGEEDMQTNRALDLQKTLETKYQRQIEDMLSKVVGAGQVMAQVSAKVNWKQIQKTEEIYDPESRVAISEQTTTDKSTGNKGNASGAPGSASTLPGGAGGQAAGSTFNQDSKRTESQAQYQVSKTVKHTVEPSGEIQKLSVAVMVDGTYEGEGEKQTFKMRPPEEIAKFDDIVKKVVGFSADRGDEVKVECMQFKQIPGAEAAAASLPSESFMKKYVMDNVKLFLVILLGAIFLFLLIKLIASQVPLSGPTALAPQAIVGQRVGSIAIAPPAGVGQLEGAAAGPERQITGHKIERSEESLKLEEAKKTVEGFARNNIDDTIRSLRAWLLEG